MACAEYEDAEGNKQARARVSHKVKVKKFFYKLTAAGHAEGEEHKSGEEPGQVPLMVEGNLNKGARKLHWTSPMFEADVEGRSGNKLCVQTKEGFGKVARSV